MEESKVANQYRRVVNKILDKGGQLPIPNTIKTHYPLSSPLPIPPILTVPKRRSREIIVQSGVYEPEKAPPGPTNPLTAKNNYLCKLDKVLQVVIRYLVINIFRSSRT